MRLNVRYLLNLFTFLTTLITPFVAKAQNVTEPQPWQMHFQEAASPIARHIHALHDRLLYIIFGVGIFVLILLAYTIIRYYHKFNPKPSTTTHNTLIEIIWTAIPVMIVLYIALPSVKLIYAEHTFPKADVTLKVTGHQWYWSYEYPETKTISFDSTMIPDKDLKPGQRRLLDVDNRVVLPINTNIRVILTSQDVIHSWAVPALGIKMDTVPGRLNEVPLLIDRPGVFYGQCSEICGQNHGFMPICIEAVTMDQYTAWVKSKGGHIGPDESPVAPAPAAAPVLKK